MVNLQKFRTEGVVLDEKQLDTIFEIYIRPLKSKNARNIFKILVEQLDVEYLTTLDLQTKLLESEIDLSKKEINGWLCSLQDSGLISKGEHRGKPTTIEYEDKYTFDMWSPTSQGIKIAKSLDNFLGNKTDTNLFNTDKWMNTLTQKDKETSQLMLEDLVNAYVQISALRALWMKKGSITIPELLGIITPTKRMFERIISIQSDHPLFNQIIKNSPNSLIRRFIRILGLSLKDDKVVCLTSEGKKLAEKIWSLK